MKKLSLTLLTCLLFLSPNVVLSETFPDGEKYVGEWKDDLMHGRGTYTFPDGMKRSGFWIKNEYIYKSGDNTKSLDP